MPTWWWVVYTLAVMRLTGLLAKDYLFEPVREYLVDRLDPTKGWHRKLAYLAGGATDDKQGCPWCLSMWIAAAAAPAVWFCGDRPWMIIPAFALAISQVTGMTASIGRG